MLEKIFKKFNPFAQCKKYQIPIWECPSFLFVLMGFIIVCVILLTYFISVLKINEPEIVSLIVLGTAVILFVIDYIVMESFEKIYQANRIKTEFISIASHQLKTPLTNFKFCLETMMSDDLAKIPEKQIGYLNILKENTKRMIDLVKNLLVVSKIETKGISLKKENVSLKEITQIIILDFKLFAEASNIKIKFNAEKNLPLIFADCYWLKEIIKILLENAIQYSSVKGEVEIKIYSKNEKIYFKIQDTGVGIPAEEQKNIFQKFFRAKNILRHQTQGNGLDLFVAKQILKLMKGKIWFKSPATAPLSRASSDKMADKPARIGYAKGVAGGKENRGTTFYFCLPISKQNE
ncbi:HAMP domain-containing histidine kinase [Patescibacteria group bacterium]|nr:HAMP domain-containing histidine kinase [Patescibacteria group bacterium]